jgi:hypothetical protein
MPAGACVAAPRLIEQLRKPDYREVQRRYGANYLFIHTDDQQRKEHILRNDCSARVAVHTAD